MIGRPMSAFLFVICTVCLVAWSAAHAPRLPGSPMARLLPELPNAKGASQLRPTPVDFTPVSRIGVEDDLTRRPGAAPPPEADAPFAGVDFAPMLAAAAAYQKGDLAGGDALAKASGDGLQRLALEWIALRSAPHVDFARLASFRAAHPGWAADAWIRYRQEGALYGERARPAIVNAFFAAEPPRTAAGKLALARVAQDAGHRDQAAALVRGVWRDSDLDGWTEAALLSEFAAVLSGADYKFRAERLLYAEKPVAALRAAALAGVDMLALAKVWADAIRGPVAETALDTLPAALKGDPALLYLRVQSLRRADRVIEAAQMLRHAPRAAALIDGDRWWNERRMIARRLLDGGLVKDAYALCAEHSAASIPARIDAEFHAGWIALRFLKDAKVAADHFAAVAAIAQTPLSIARAAYWQGRAAESAQRDDDAQRFYERAAAYPVAYYGQLAAAKLHIPALTLRAPMGIATGEARNETTRVVELLYAAKLDAFALPLAIEAARSYRDEPQLAALAAVAAARRDGQASVEIGKQAMERGFALDESAFPVFGVPSFAPLANSADLAAVYSVARQESEFAGAAASGAGAKGLMQLLPSTARDTAKRAGVAFDAARLTADPAYNTQLGAAFLGQLINDEGGSYLLALAAYNAGGGRVQQWIGAYGDPREPNVDPVDWVERIPFDETRDYVQHVYENLQVYRMRLTEVAKVLANPPTGSVARADF